MLYLYFYCFGKNAYKSVVNEEDKYNLTQKYKTVKYRIIILLINNFNFCNDNEIKSINYKKISFTT